MRIPQLFLSHSLPLHSIRIHTVQHTHELTAWIYVVRGLPTVKVIGESCKSLKTLSLAGCLELCPHEGLPALLSKMPQLERLDLAHCTQVTTQAIPTTIQLDFPGTPSPYQLLGIFLTERCVDLNDGRRFTLCM